ncbi:putative spermidine/putrescine transport system permease protein [Rhizomicrobium palustre]|uniref:Putative spermidine/putrescine transport system permease protein n=1 Tax=Rhizomicrobium palustre TaxID=189966 RepID=A0A846N2R3_9PROT|nr:ABC transporter permease [Rhizomicrobium palustre]NIK89512.1 putative spermidine/putrescine transport system permease protein [Rhizomicrobium palustre]
MKTSWLKQSALLAWPGFLLISLAAFPFLLLLRISLAPYDPAGLWAEGFTLSAYRALVQPEVFGAILNGIELSASVAAASLILGFPLTYFITRMRRRAQILWLILLLTTLTLSDVLIAFAWQVMLSKKIGLSNILVMLGIMAEPMSLTPSRGAVLSCLIYLMLPFSVLTLYPSLSRLDNSLVEAARTMGASPFKAFFSVIVPMARAPATMTVLLAIIFTMGAYAPPIVLGAPKQWPLAVLIGSTAQAGHDLPRAAAMAVLLMLATATIALFTLLLTGRKKRL